MTGTEGEAGTSLRVGRARDSLSKSRLSQYGVEAPEASEVAMQITVKGRNLTVTEECREQVVRRFDRVAKQVSDLAVLEVELCEERNPANPSKYTAEATLFLKGTTLRAQDGSKDVNHAISLIADEMAVQVKRHRDKRRGRREARSTLGSAEAPPLP
jgi:putative sigma-54 modulation protein